MSKIIRKVTYLDPGRHGDILDWLAKQDSESAAIRQALCAFVRRGRETNDPIDLLAIRDAAAAGARDALAGLSITSPGVQEGEDDEIESLLDELGDNLML